MTQRVAVVTDSTASLPSELASRWGIAVVNMQLRIGDELIDEAYVPTERVLQAMRDGTPISTAVPASDALFWAYQDAWGLGMDATVSLHLSAQLSSAAEMALAASTHVRTPVHIVDSQSSGMTLGFAALTAARVASEGGTAAHVYAAAARRAKAAKVLIYVDTLEYLRRSGRIGSAAAFVGSTLSIKPLLTVRDGAVEPIDKVFGAERAVKKITDQAVEMAADQQVDVAVEHFAAPDEGAELLAELRGRIPRGREFVLSQVSAAIGSNVGPGALAVTISPL